MKSFNVGKAYGQQVKSFGFMVAPIALTGAMAFDRETGEPVPSDVLKTYAETFALFHLSPEDKFANGGPWNVGRTEPRHIVVSRIQLIGKEANRVGPSSGPDPTGATTFTFNTHNEGVVE